MKRFLLFILLLTSLANADYYGSYAIDAYLTVQETLHDSSGDAVAATGAVDIWVYEDDNDTQIIDLTMSAFDSITGLYEEKFQLTSGAGFEAGKTYTILIQATADGASGIITHTFQILASTDAVLLESGDPSDALDKALTDYDPPTDTEMLAAHTTTDALVNGIDDNPWDAGARTLTANTNFNDPTAAAIVAKISTGGVITFVDIADANIIEDCGTQPR